MVELKTPEEIEIMAEGGKILARIMKELERRVCPGITTKELDKVAEDLVLKYGGKCSFKGYDGYPACLCASVEKEIVHAVPSSRILKEGEIISLDLGVFWKGFHSDMAVTAGVGKISLEKQKLIDITREALGIGIEKVRPGNYIGDIAHAIQRYVEEQGFNVVRELCGHGIGKNVHEDPEILNSVSFEKDGSGKVKFCGDADIRLKAGMVLCLEPMVTVGDWHIKKSKDGFGWETKDNSLSCHFEHMVAVTENGYKVLTKIN